jgi:hypothetical protein
VLAVTPVAGVTAYAFSGGGAVASAGGGLAATGAVALIAAIVLRLPFVVPWAVLFAGSGYVVSHIHDRVIDGWAAVVGTALLLAAELAAWSIASDRRIYEERAVVLARSVTLAALVATAGVVSFLLVGAAAVSASAGLLLTGVGVAAAVAAVAVVLRLVAR